MAFDNLEFNREKGQRAFREEVNQIFARNGLAFELLPDGRVIRTIPELVGQALTIARFKTGDDVLNGLLESAKDKVLDHDLAVRKEGAGLIKSIVSVGRSRCVIKDC